MKKSNIIGYFLLLFGLFFIPSITNATQLVAVGDCAYGGFFKGTINSMNSYFTSGGKMHFYYTDLRLAADKNDPTGDFYVRHSTDDYQSYSSGGIYGRDGELGAIIKVGRIPYEYDNMAETEFFESINAGHCPQYFVIKLKKDKSKDADKEYYLHFTDEDATSYCGSDYSSCYVAAKLSSDDSIKIETSQLAWTAKTYSQNSTDKNSCNGTNIKVYFDNSGIMKADISVDKSSSWYESSAKKVVTVNVQSDGVNAEDLIADFHRIITTGTIKSGIVRSDSGHEKFYLHGSAGSNKTCNLGSNAGQDPKQYSEDFDCVTYESVKSTIDTKWSAFTSKAPSFDPKTADGMNSVFIMHEPYNYELSADGSMYVPKSITESNYQTMLTNVNNMKSKMDTVLSNLQSFKTYIEGLNICLQDAATIQKKLDAAITVSQTYEKITKGLAEASRQIEEIAKKKADEEAAEQAEQNQEDLEEIGSEFENVAKTFKVIKERENSLDDMKDFEAKEGCNLISNNLKDFLQTVLDYIRIAGIALAIILQVVDYIKVVFGSSDDGATKANKRLGIRMVSIGLLFLIPSILQFILSLYSIAGTATMSSGTSGTCGIL